MYEATMKPPMKEVNESTKAATEDAVLNPRFYTTDFDEMDRLDVSALRKDWDELVDEFRRDPNKDHFKRTSEFENLDWTGWSPELQKAFIEFLVSSVTAEFSGCILYAEIKKRVKNKDIRDLFGFMSRDEGRMPGSSTTRWRISTWRWTSRSSPSQEVHVLQAQVHLLRHVPLGEDRVRALHHDFPPAREAPRVPVPPDLQVVPGVVQRRVPARRGVRGADARQPAVPAGWQQALDPLLPAGRVRHDVRARPCADDVLPRAGL